MSLLFNFFLKKLIFFKSKGFAPAVAGGVGVGEYGACNVTVGLGIGQGRAVMSEPKLRSLCLSRDLRRLAEHHVLVFFRFRYFVLFAVHPLADEEVRAFRRLYGAFAGAGVCTVADLLQT